MRTAHLSAIAVILSSCLLSSCNRGQYRVVERADVFLDKQGNQIHEPFLNPAYDHDEIHFVLKRGDQKIHAYCDLTTVNNLDPHATCSLRVLQEYKCTQKGYEVSAKALADLFCKDKDGGIVYLYVTKEE